ncbi:MAG: DUF1552 domain-containing protein [Aureliella sp.]
MYFTTRSSLSRRHLLRGLGAAAVGLPMLEAMGPTVGSAAFALEPDQQPRRFVAICATLGFHTPFLFPAQEGRDYKLTPYLSKLAEHRDALTVLSGLSHPDQQGNNGHASELTWLTSARRPGLAGFRNSASIDQIIASKVGLETRLPFLALSTSGRSMSWNASGVEIPAETSPAKLFKLLFTEGTTQEKEKEMLAIRRGKSILDTVGNRAGQLQGQVSRRDRVKIDEYLTAVRELESRLQQSEGWAKKPKPQTDATPPKDIADRNDTIAKQDLMYEMICLALQSDSTRTVTLQLSGLNSVPVIPGVQSDWHGLSHHGKDPKKIDELKIIEEAEFTAFGRFLSRLKSMEESSETLMDRTAVLFGSNLGNASAHDWRNLPLLVAGGNFEHGGYVAHNKDANTPFANLLVQLAQSTGIEIDEFGSSTSHQVRGLKVKRV